MKIYDCFIFYNELDILEIRLNELAPVVDYFVIVECRQTFTGQQKPLYFSENRQRFSKFSDRFIHVVLDTFPPDLTRGLACEHFQRDAIARGLIAAQPEDIILVSDVDEIPPAAVVQEIIERQRFRDSVIYFQMAIYHFKLNWRVERRKRQFNTQLIQMRHFPGAQALRAHRGMVSQSAPRFIDHLAWRLKTMIRFRKPLQRVLIENRGWHFSFMFDKDGIRAKVRAYGHFDRERGPNLSDESLEHRFIEGKSMHGDRMYSVPLENLPDYVRLHSQRFAHLLEID